MDQIPDKTPLSDDVRKLNKLRILQAFRKEPLLSRTQLAKATGLSAGTITNITTKLLNHDVLITAPPPKTVGTAQGRPQVQLALNPSFAQVLHGSLSYGRLTLCISDYSGKRRNSAVDMLMTPGLTGLQIAAKISKTIDLLCTKKVGLPAPKVLSLGVQGTTAKARDAILWSPILDETALSLPDDLVALAGIPVMIENDCAMITRALNHRQSGMIPTFGSVLMSYGIGMGLQVNGEQFSGGRSSATEFGHLPYRPGGAQCRCGKRGCIEAYASDYAIWRAATGQDRNTLPEARITSEMMQTIIARAQASDGPDREALRDAAHALGVGLATMFTLFDPFPVVFTGPGSSLVSLLEEELRASLRENYRFRQRPNLKFQTEAEETTLIEEGAAIAAFEDLDRKTAYSVEPMNSVSKV